jgi:hypothetical protein
MKRPTAQKSAGCRSGKARLRHPRWSFQGAGPSIPVAAWLLQMAMRGRMSGRGASSQTHHLSGGQSKRRRCRGPERGRSQPADRVAGGKVVLVRRSTTPLRSRSKIRISTRRGRYFCTSAATGATQMVRDDRRKKPVMGFSKTLVAPSWSGAQSWHRRHTLQLMEVGTPWLGSATALATSGGTKR